MRFSTTSSSLLLATLAISASSTALAAPTEPEAGEQAMVPSSSSNFRSIAMLGHRDTARVAVGESSLQEIQKGNTPGKCAMILCT